MHIECFDIMPDAIAREKQLKRWHRAWKIDLIAVDNPTWRDLAEDFGFAPVHVPGGLSVRGGEEGGC